MSVRRLTRTAVLVLATLWSSAAWTGFAYPAEDALQTVELHLKIVPPPAEKGYKIWEVELLDSQGQSAARRTAAGGDTVRFKNVKPDIYAVCLSGHRQGHRCESMDLIPSEGAAAPRFVRQIQAPRRGSGFKDSYFVSVATLAAPQKAVNEISRYTDAKRRGDMQQALSHLERALQIYPDYPQALNDLGAYLQRKGEYRQAILKFRRAVELEPSYYASWLNMGKSYLALGQYDQAVASSLRALQLRPKDPLANSQIAMSYYYQKAFDRAADYFERVAELDPASASTPQLYLARIAFTHNRKSEGARHLQEFITLHPNAPQSEKFRSVLQNLMQQAAMANGPTGNIR